MKSIKVKILLGVASCIIGYLIVINFNLAGNLSSSQLSASEYQDAQEEKNKLVKEISSLTESNDILKNKIIEYTTGSRENSNIFEDMKSQVKDYGLLTGLYQTKGPGVKITILDGDRNVGIDTNTDINLKTLHDKDMERVINEIKLAGGEAITVNNHRISANSGLTCRGFCLIFEDKDTVYAPFEIYTIGDPDSLEKNLLLDGSYLNKLKIRGLKVTVEKCDEIIMPASKATTMQFASEYIKE